MTPQEPSSSKGPGGAAKQIALALELPFLLVAPVVAGGILGYFLDRWLHTKPILMIVLGILGVVMGIRDVVKIASAGEK